MSLSSRLPSIRQILASGNSILAAGVLTLGLSSYVFLLLAGRRLGDAAYAPLGAMWVLVFLVCPALFFPVEQELGRAIAARRAQGLGAGPIVKSACKVVSITVLILLLTGVVAGQFITQQLFNGSRLLGVGFLLCIVTFAAEYVARGTLAGNQRLGTYGVVIGIDGVVRVVLAALLVFAGVKTAGPYGVVVGISPLVAVAVAFLCARAYRVIDDGPPAHMQEFTTAVGTLILASILSQTLVNAAPLIVKYSASATQQDLAGAFTKAVIVTRIPLFLFQAVQAAMLPKLTHHSARGEHESFRALLRFILFVVTAVGAIGAVGAFVFGDFALKIFGSDYNLSHSDMFLLAAGNAVFLLCMTAAQALVAVSAQRQTVVSWFLGLLTFIAVCFTPGNIVTRVESALLIGAFVAFVVMMSLLAKVLRSTQGHIPALIDALRPGNEMIET